MLSLSTSLNRSKMLNICIFHKGSCYCFVIVAWFYGIWSNDGKKEMTERIVNFIEYENPVQCINLYFQYQSILKSFFMAQGKLISLKDVIQIFLISNIFVRRFEYFSCFLRDSLHYLITFLNNCCFHLTRSIISKWPLVIKTR